MPHFLDYALSESKKAEMAAIPREAWFTSFQFQNAHSPKNTSDPQLDDNHNMKMQLVLPWIRQSVKGKRVLDVFCANGAFAIEAALSGAQEVLGIDFSKERVDCATFLASTLPAKIATIPRFVTGDVYELSSFTLEPFDIVLAFGGLYHVADPPHVLTKIRSLTRERMIVQTSSILPGRRNHAEFVLRRQDRTKIGLSSIRGGYGAWAMSVACFDSVLRHAKFRVLETRYPPLLMRRKFPWYCALTEPI